MLWFVTIHFSTYFAPCTYKRWYTLFTPYIGMSVHILTNVIRIDASHVPAVPSIQELLVIGGRAKGDTLTGVEGV